MTPDRDLIRRKALVAAGTVVLALGSIACEPAESYGDYELEAADDTGADYGDADGEACDEDDEGGAFDWLSGPDCTDIADSEEWSDCCETRSAYCKARFPLNPNRALECTYGPDYDGSTGCIPWGPPVPPGFRAAVA